MNQKNINETNESTRDNNKLIIITSILFIMSFIVSVILGAVFDNIVIASMPIILFWVIINSNTLSVQDNS